MGRSFEGVSQDVKASRALKKEDQVYGQMIAKMARKPSSDTFYALVIPSMR